MQIPRLHPDTVEEVKHRADIVDVISDYVVLRRRGKDFVGLCPFHEEKTPSFTVSPTKQIYYCFGCQASGNAIKFMMDLNKRQFAEVVLDLAKRYQVPVKTLAPEQRQELQRQLSLREQLFEVLASTSQFYQHVLRQDIGQQALQYLQKKRFLKTETVEKFALGYAPPGWETLYHYLVENKNYPAQLVEKAGLIKPRKEGGGYYDVFRNRLMIPIRDVQGRVIAFGGRTLTDEQPKYLNSPETELFDKSKTLFALDVSKDAISKLDQAVVVEGYFDAIALHANGINNVVASLGTALSLEQVRLLLRYSESKQLVLNFDGDKAGINATERAIGEISNLAYKGEVQLKILHIPDGKDADEYLKNHSVTDYGQLLVDAPLWLDWQIAQVIQGRDLRQPTDFQLVSREFVKLLQKILNSDTLNYYISHCAEILSLGDTRLIPLRVENLITQVAPRRTPTPRPPQPDSTTSPNTHPISHPQPSLLEQAEGLLLRIFLHCPQERQVIIETLGSSNLEFSVSHHRFLWEKSLQFPSQTLDLISQLQNLYLETQNDLGPVQHIFQLNEKNKQEILLRTSQLVQAAIACMEKVFRENRYRHFLELWQKTDPSTDPDQYSLYAQTIYADKMRIQELSKQRQLSISDLIN